MNKATKKTLVLIISIGLFGTSELSFGQEEQANDALLQGSWEVTQITIEKNTEGKIEKMAYDNAGKIQSRIPCPQKWVFKDSTAAALHFQDDREETTEFSLDGDELTIRYAGAVLKYQYVVSGEKLTLITTQNYSWNQPSGQIEKIEEKWAIVLNKCE